MTTFYQGIYPPATFNPEAYLPETANGQSEFEALPASPFQINHNDDLTNQTQITDACFMSQIVYHPTTTATEGSIVESIPVVETVTYQVPSIEGLPQPVKPALPEKTHVEFKSFLKAPPLIASYKNEYFKSSQSELSEKDVNIFSQIVIQLLFPDPQREAKGILGNVLFECMNIYEQLPKTKPADMTDEEFQRILSIWKISSSGANLIHQKLFRIQINDDDVPKYSTFYDEMMYCCDIIQKLVISNKISKTMSLNEFLTLIASDKMISNFELTKEESMGLNGSLKWFQGAIPLCAESIKYAMLFMLMLTLIDDKFNNYCTMNQIGSQFNNCTFKECREFWTEAKMNEFFQQTSCSILPDGSPNQNYIPSHQEFFYKSNMVYFLYSFGVFHFKQIEKLTKFIGENLDQYFVDIETKNAQDLYDIFVDFLSEFENEIHSSSSKKRVDENLTIMINAFIYKRIFEVETPSTTITTIPQSTTATKTASPLKQQPQKKNNVVVDHKKPELHFKRKSDSSSSIVASKTTVVTSTSNNKKRKLPPPHPAPVSKKESIVAQKKKSVIISTPVVQSSSSESESESEVEQKQKSQSKKKRKLPIVPQKTKRVESSSSSSESESESEKPPPQKKQKTITVTSSSTTQKSPVVQQQQKKSVIVSRPSPVVVQKKQKIVQQKYSSDSESEAERTAAAVVKKVVPPTVTKSAPVVTPKKQSTIVVKPASSSAPPKSVPVVTPKKQSTIVVKPASSSAPPKSAPVVSPKVAVSTSKQQQPPLLVQLLNQMSQMQKAMGQMQEMLKQTCEKTSIVYEGLGFNLDQSFIDSQKES